MLIISTSRELVQQSDLTAVPNPMPDPRQSSDVMQNGMNAETYTSCTYSSPKSPFSALHGSKQVRTARPLLPAPRPTAPGLPAFTV